MEIAIKHEVKNEVIANLLCSAFEGGSNYWAHIIRSKSVKPTDFKNSKEEEKGYEHISYPMNEGGELTIEDLEDDNKLHKLNLASIRRGLKRMAKMKPQRFAELVKEDPDTDAEDADIFLQFCIFGEIIYG